MEGKYEDSLGPGRCRGTSNTLLTPYATNLDLHISGLTFSNQLQVGVGYFEARRAAVQADEDLWKYVDVGRVQGSRPEKWIAISAIISTCLADWHEMHGIGTAPFRGDQSTASVDRRGPGSL
jgi:hypothetical protein